MDKELVDRMILPTYVRKLVDVIKPSLWDVRHEFDGVDLTQCRLTSEITESGNGFEFVFENCWILGLTSDEGQISCKLQANGGRNYTAVVHERLHDLARLYHKQIMSFLQD